MGENRKDDEDGVGQTKRVVVGVEGGTGNFQESTYVGTDYLRKCGVTFCILCETYS